MISENKIIINRNNLLVEYVDGKLYDDIELNEDDIVVTFDGYLDIKKKYEGEPEWDGEAWVSSTDILKPIPERVPSEEELNLIKDKEVTDFLMSVLMKNNDLLEQDNESLKQDITSLLQRIQVLEQA